MQKVNITYSFLKVIDYILTISENYIKKKLILYYEFNRKKMLLTK